MNTEGNTEREKKERMKGGNYKGAEREKEKEERVKARREMQREREREK